MLSLQPLKTLTFYFPFADLLYALSNEHNLTVFFVDYIIDRNAQQWIISAARYDTSEMSLGTTLSILILGRILHAWSARSCQH